MRQPFASLIVAGVKLYEGRSWQTSHRGPIAIHASGAKPDKALLHERPIWKSLDDADLMFDELPCGQLIGVVSIVEMVDGAASMRTVAKKHRLLVDPADGDTSEYYLWRLADPWRLPEPITIHGSLNLWRLPEPIIARVARAMQ